MSQMIAIDTIQTDRAKDGLGGSELETKAPLIAIFNCPPDQSQLTKDEIVASFRAVQSRTAILDFSWFQFAD